MDLVNFGVLSSKIVAIQALDGTFNQPHFHDLMSRSCENEWLAILKRKAEEILLNKYVLCYFVLPSERTDAMLPFGVACSLVFMTQ